MADEPRDLEDANAARNEDRDDPQSRARALLEAADREAGALLREAREQVAAQIAEAAEMGKHEGFSQAEQMREQIAVLEQRMLQEVEAEVVRAALKISAELLDIELAQRATAIVDLVFTALQSARNAKDVYLRVNPRDAKILREHTHRLIDALGRAREIDVREDRNVAPGGVLIQTEAGVIDAQLETQLAEISMVLGA